MDMLYFMSYLKFSNINCIGYHFTNSNMFGSLRKEKRIKKRRTNDNLTIATSHFVFMIFFFGYQQRKIQSLSNYKRLG